MTGLIVTKRLFAYEFVIRTHRSVRENVTRLEQYLARPRPKGFFLSDPRFNGRLFGSTFSLRPYDALLWGTQVPGIEGIFVPSEEGSDVVVRVAPTATTRWLLVLLLAIAAIAVY